MRSHKEVLTVFRSKGVGSEFGKRTEWRGEADTFMTFEPTLVYTALQMQTPQHSHTTIDKATRTLRLFLSKHA